MEMSRNIILQRMHMVEDQTKASKDASTLIRKMKMGSKDIYIGSTTGIALFVRRVSMMVKG